VNGKVGKVIHFNSEQRILELDQVTHTSIKYPPFVPERDYLELYNLHAYKEVHT
jgi:hypothetical protein